MKIEAHYPSGNILNFEGKFMCEDLPGHSHQPMVDTGGQLHVLDARAVIWQDGNKVYSPRVHMDHMDKGLVKWLQDNPAWDRILPMQGKE